MWKEIFPIFLTQVFPRLRHFLYFHCSANKVYVFGLWKLVDWKTFVDVSPKSLQMSSTPHSITFLSTLYPFLDKIMYSLNYDSKLFHTYSTSTVRPHLSLLSSFSIA